MDDFRLRRREVRVLKAEEMFWHLKAKCKWLSEGDGNTKIFHRVANGNK